MFADGEREPLAAGEPIAEDGTAVGLCMATEVSHVARREGDGSRATCLPEVLWEEYREVFVRADALRADGFGARRHA